jgi:hypothetical protein
MLQPDVLTLRAAMDWLRNQEDGYVLHFIYCHRQAAARFCKEVASARLEREAYLRKQRLTLDKTDPDDSRQ